MSDQYISTDDYVTKVEGDGKNRDEYDSMFKALKADPIKYSYELIRTCEDAMSSAYGRWKRYRKKYRRGNRYLGMDLGNTPLYSTNYIYNVVETLKANLTRYLPEITVQPEEYGDTKSAELMTKLISKTIDRSNYKAKLSTQVHHSAITGSGWMKVSYDPDLFDGKGDVAIIPIAPEDLLVLPYELDYHEGTLFIHRVRDVSVDELKSTYDVKTIDRCNFKSKVDSDRSTEGSRKVSVGRTLDLYELWIKNFEDGKWYTLSIAGNTVLKKLSPSIYNHNKHPFTVWHDGYDAGADQAYSLGVGEVEEIEALQDLADSLDMRIYKNIKQIVARQKVLNPASGINPHDIDDTPSRIYQCTGRPQDAMMWDSPPSLSNDVYMFRERLEDRIQTVSGILDVTQGKPSGSNQAAKAIGALQQAAQARIEYKTESLLEAIQSTLELVVSIQLQFYTDERIIRLEGGELFKIAGDYPEILSQGQIDPMTGESMEIDEGEVEMAKVQWKMENEVDLVLSDIDFKYDLRVSTHSALPSDRGARSQLYYDFFRIGAIDRQGLLDGLDFPNKSDILTRLAKQTTGKTPDNLDEDNQPAIQQQMEQEMMMQQQAQQGQEQGTSIQDLY